MVSLLLRDALREVNEEKEREAVGFLCSTCLTGDRYLHDISLTKSLINPQECAGCGEIIDTGLTINYISEKISEHLHKHYKLIEPKQNEIDKLVDLQTIISRFVTDKYKAKELISDCLCNVYKDKFKPGKVYEDLFDQTAIDKKTKEVVKKWEKYKIEFMHGMRFTNKAAIDFYGNIISHGVRSLYDKEKNISPMFKIIESETVIYRAPFIALMKLKEGSSYVLNCPCGEPGCAGIEHPFTISLDGNNVKLSTPVEEFSEILISNKYAITLINELSEKIISISKENTVPVVLQEDEYGIIFEDEIKDYDIKLTFKEKIKEYENLIKEELEYETKRA